MANEVEIRVIVKDASGNALVTAISGQKKLAAAAGESSQALGKAEKSAAGMGSTLGKVGQIAAGILAADFIKEGAQKVVEFMHSTVEAASSLGESVNAVQKIFRENSTEVINWGKTNAEQFGLSQRAFNEAATPLGAMLKNTGMDMKDVTSNTIALTQRAADMASVFNTSVPDALTAIQAALRGETDPIERYGVSLSAVNVEARALADTGKSSALALTSQEKAAARLALIFEQTKDSAGDFAATSDGLANSTRIATAMIEDAKAKVGTLFIPIMAAAAQVTGNLAQTIGNLPAPLVLTIAGVAGLAAALLVLAPRIMATKRAVDEMILSQSRVTAGMGKFALAAGKIAGILGVVQVAGAVLNAMTKDLAPQVDALTVSMLNWDKASQLGGEAARVFGKDAEELADSLAGVAAKGWGKAINSISEGVLGVFGADGDFAKSRAQVDAFDQALAQMVASGHAQEAASVVEEIAKRANISVTTAQGALHAYAGALETAVTPATKGMAAATGDAAMSIDDLRRSFDELIKKTFGVEEAEDKIADTVARLTDQIAAQKKANDKGAGSFDRHTQAGRDNEAMVRDLFSEYSDLAVAYQQNGKSVDGLKGKLEAQLRNLGYSARAAHDLAGKLGEITKALDAIPTYKVIKIKTIVSTQYEVANKQYNQNTVPGHAAGGIVGGSGMTWLGEDGPELGQLPVGSTVVPAPTSRAMANGSAMAGGVSSPTGAGTSAAPHFTIGSDGSRLGDALIDLIANAVRTRGGNPAVLGIRV